MSKDVNIHLKTTGVEKTQADLDRTGQSAKDLGGKVAEGQRQAAASTDQASKRLRDQHGRFVSAGQAGRQAGQEAAEGQQQAGAATDHANQKLGVMGGLFNRLRSQVVGFVTAFLGIQTVVRVVTYLITQLERVAELQKTIYEKSLQFAEIGQRLEFQTGTIGRQPFWTKEAISLQKAGALQGPDVAQQMLVSMDIAFAQQGGIKNQAIRDLAKQLAPFVGAAGIGQQEVSKLFEFAGAAGIEPAAESYKDYFAKLKSGFTASKATNFGQFMEALQKGGTGYMAMGGTLEEAISIFSSARAVTANEALAATLVEQIARLSGGGYEKPRKAMEEALGVKWPAMTMDQRTAALLEHVRRLPEAERAQTLAEQGFPQELATGTSKMVSPEAMRTLESTRRVVGEAKPSMVDQTARAYTDSMLGRELELQADIAGREAARGPDFANWQRRLRDAQSRLNDQLSTSSDRWIKDNIEPIVIALEDMQQEFLGFGGGPPKETDPGFRLYEDIRKARNKLHDFSLVYSEGMAKKEAYDLSKRFDAFVESRSALPVAAPPAIESPPPEAQQAEPNRFGPVSYNYDHRVIHQTIFNPVVGMNKQDLRIEPPYLS